MKEEKFNHPKEEYHDFSFLKTTHPSKWNEEYNKERINIVVKQLGIDPKCITFTNHHFAHAYYAAPVNRKKRTIVLTADGWGDGENASIYLAENGKLKKVLGTSNCHLSRIYRYVTLILGMKPFEHEYKVMGLAPYAKDYVAKPAYEIFKKTLVVDGLDFKWKEKPSDMYFYFRDRLEGIRFDGVAGGLQKWLEEIVVEWIGKILKKFKADYLVFSGGLSQNVKANKSIWELKGIRYFFVAASGGDESTAMGAAYAEYVNRGGKDPKPLKNAYLGYAITEEEIQKLLKKYHIRKTYQVIEKATPGEIAKLLAKNKVIARAAGRGEFGARALGNRSIICNPANFDNIRLINEKVKNRDFWMPFAPSILDYRVKDYLINPKNIAAPYMTIGFDTTKLAQKELKAGIHPSDSTARPQIVTKEANPEYYEIIQAFEKETGIGGVLNTSFNLHGDPIVGDAEDAWYTFTHADLDGLLLNSTLILKR